MPRRVPLDPRLLAAPFRVTDGLQAGHSRDRLDGGDLSRPFHGVRDAADRPRHESYVPLLRPGDRFSHTTAAAMWGMPLPHQTVEPIHVTAGRGLQRPRSRGVIGHIGTGGATVWRSGLPISSPLETFLEIAGMIRREHLVAIADYLVLDPRVLDPWLDRPLVTLADLRVAVAASRARGARAARAAAGAARTGVESPMETALRLILLAAGIPEPVCGFELHGIGWFDLAWPQWRVIAEYDGDQHRTSSQQYERDIRRFDLAADLDWRVIRVRKRGVLVDTEATAQRVRGALVRGGWAPTGRESGAGGARSTDS